MDPDPDSYTQKILITQQINKLFGEFTRAVSVKYTSIPEDLIPWIRCGYGHKGYVVEIRQYNGIKYLCLGKTIKDIDNIFGGNHGRNQS